MERVDQPAGGTIKGRAAVDPDESGSGGAGRKWGDEMEGPISIAAVAVLGPAPDRRNGVTVRIGFRVNDVAVRKR